jgi:hypothetical protein
MDFIKKSKYRNQPTIVDGIRFASKKEAKRYHELKILKQSCRVKEFELQKSYKLAGRYRYVCDFFVKWRNGTETVEDVKGFKTPVYKLKKAWMKDKYNIDIVEI